MFLSKVGVQNDCESLYALVCCSDIGIATATASKV
jgi:hypothetical protein